MEKIYLENVISELRCGSCFEEMNVNVVRKDLDCKINVQCEDCGKGHNSEISDKNYGSGYEGLHRILSNLYEAAW